MRFIKIIYYSQYYELKNAGKDPQKGRLNGTLLSATIIILLLGSFFILLFKLEPYLPMVQWMKRSALGYQGTGKALGELLGAILIIFIGGLLWLTIGSERSYNKIAEDFMQLPDEVQKRTIQQSLYIFLFSFAVFLVLLFIP